MTKKSNKFADSLSVAMDGGGLESSTTRTDVCCYCHKKYTVPTSYIIYRSDFDEATFCSYNCRCAYYKEHEKERQEQKYLNSIEGKDAKKIEFHANYYERVLKVKREQAREKRKASQKGLVGYRICDIKNTMLGNCEFIEFCSWHPYIGVQTDLKCKIAQWKRLIRELPNAEHYLLRKVMEQSQTEDGKTLILRIARRIEK